MISVENIPLYVLFNVHTFKIQFMWFQYTIFIV